MYNIKPEALMFRSLTSIIMKSFEREDKVLPYVFLSSLTSANGRFIRNFRKLSLHKSQKYYKFRFYNAKQLSSQAVSPEHLV